jgi:hypothetical protein
MKRYACVSGVSTRHHGEPMKRSGARVYLGCACVFVAIFKSFSN